MLSGLLVDEMWKEKALEEGVKPENENRVFQIRENGRKDPFFVFDRRISILSM